MRAEARRLLSGLSLALLAGCLTPAVAGTAPSAGDRDAYTESGEASWYGPRHEGLLTTSGERFDSSKLTAAHASLPLGSYVRVTVQRTGRSVVVRVNDREPPHGVRCIDLSRAAAARLGFVDRGVADVTLAQVDPSDVTEVAEAPDEPPALVQASARRGRLHRRRGHR